jgi:hypothetical protein
VDAAEFAVREFCFAPGRALPPSIFLGRIVQPGEPEWLDTDTAAALEWQAYQKSLCLGGCGRPREESFDIAMDDHYDVTPIACNACRARDLKAWNRNSTREPGDPPLVGEFYIVQPETAVPAEDVA